MIDKNQQDVVKYKAYCKKGVLKMGAFFSEFAKFFEGVANFQTLA